MNRFFKEVNNPNYYDFNSHYLKTVFSIYITKEEFIISGIDFKSWYKSW